MRGGRIVGSEVMRVLVVDAFPSHHVDATVTAETVTVLEAQGNTVDLLSLDSPELSSFMTAEERRAYESDQPLISAATQASAAQVQAAEALVFCYPTTLFGVPPELKSWLERVMVMGVAFVFDDKQRVRPGLTNVRRLAVVTTTPHGVVRTANARDLGRRTIMRTLRLNCHPMCRRTFVRLQQSDPANGGEDTPERRNHSPRLVRAFRSWSANG